MTRLLVAVLAASSVSIAHAEDERSAADVSGAPPPGQESGRVDRVENSESAVRVVTRGVLAVPRTAVVIVFAPIRAAVWFYDRYQIGARWKQVFFNDAGTAGVYPLLRLDANYGVNFGARFVHRDLLGAREYLTLRAATGGRYRDTYLAELRTGDRLGPRFAAAVRGEVERRPRDAYYGIGNIDDPIEARHRQQLRRVFAIVDARTISAFHVRASGAYTELAYRPSDEGIPVDIAYAPTTLTGYMSGIRHVYGELELRWDSRRRVSRWDAMSVPAAGSLAAAFAGRVHQLEAGRDYWRMGLALQHFIWLGPGPRVLAARVQGETVTGSYADVAFTELPQLGGRALLRGYDIDRFRDRAAAVGTLAYRWDLNRNLLASVFVDVGRVYPSVRDISFDDMRVGYGIGLQAQTGSDFIAEVNLATSKDGGVFLNLAFDPAFDLDQRVARR